MMADDTRQQKKKHDFKVDTKTEVLTILEILITLKEKLE